MRKLRSKNIASVKVKWKGHSIEEATWELEDKMREEYPHLFNDLGMYSNILFSFEDETFIRWGDCRVLKFQIGNNFRVLKL